MDFSGRKRPNIVKAAHLTGTVPGKRMFGEILYHSSDPPRGICEGNFEACMSAARSRTLAREGMQALWN